MPAEVEGAAILTGNVIDFLALAIADPEHHGVLVVYRQNDSAKGLRAAGIVAGVEIIASRYPDGIDHLILVVNDAADKRRVEA